jgi:hypothetical protein
MSEHAPPEVGKPPARVWISGERDGDPNFYVEGEQPENGIEYAHLEPIKRALEKCAEDVSNQLDPDSKYLLVRKSGWKNLCDVIRAGSL